MVTWSEFEAAAPELAAAGHALLYRDGHGRALLATVSGDDLPRLDPISAGIVDGHLVAFLLRSGKRADLIRDGRYALHTYPEPAAPDEFALRGHARRVTDTDLRARAADDWFFDVDETYWLFEFSIESALLGRRTADEWPPRYTTWKAPAAD